MSQYDYTLIADEVYYDISDGDFSPQEIYNRIKTDLQKTSFSRVLRRLIYYSFFKDIYSEQREISLEEFKAKFVSLFKENKTPCAFTPTTAKLSVLAESCLTKSLVKRSTVFLIGFGLGFDTEKVNVLLTKGIKEHGLNPKDPFEVVCWYCYENGLSFSDFQKLWKEYESLKPNLSEDKPLYNEYTAMVQDYMYCISSENELKDYLSKLKTSENKSKISKTSLKVFNELYNDAISLLTEAYGNKRIGAQSIDRYLYNSSDDNGNTPSLNNYDFEDVFGGVRLTKQRIGKIKTEKSRVNRYDIINLCFLAFSLRVSCLEKSKMSLAGKQREFLEFTNGCLEQCMLGKMNLANAYDHMILCCIMSEDPLNTFEILWLLAEKK